MAVTAAMVKELRERTQAGMMDCKKALVETDGDMDKAIEFLREKGLAKAAKKAGRTAAEGLVRIAFSEDGKTAAIVEVNSETDFVSKNEEFVSFVEGLAKLALTAESDDIEAFKAMPFEGSTVGEVLTDKIAKIGAKRIKDGDVLETGRQRDVIQRCTVTVRKHDVQQIFTEGYSERRLHTAAAGSFCTACY